MTLFLSLERQAFPRTAIREVFASYFVNYENFIIMPKQSFEQWKKNREQFQNFDKMAFLSDQPTNYRAFYSAFAESSLFTQFIDQKIVTICEPEKADHSLRLFDTRVEQYIDKRGLAKLPTTPGPKSADSECNTHTHAHACTRTCTHAHTHTQARMHARTHTHARMHARTHARTHTHTHTHTHCCGS